MKTIFGIWRPAGPPVSSAELSQRASHTARFACDGEFTRIAPQIGMGLQRCHTDERSQLDRQPFQMMRAMFLYMMVVLITGKSIPIY